MTPFKSYLEEERQEDLWLQEQSEELFEALITFGGKAFPKYGNVVIMAGGAGSGKGFVLDKLVGIEGKVFDVDALKTLIANAPKINKRVKDEYGYDLKNLGSNLKDPENVRNLHMIAADILDMPNKRQAAFFASVLTADPDRKPNIVFDVTLKDLKKLDQITRQVSEIGYDKKNIHIVWVVNDIEVAKRQNASRARTVPVDILVNTHRGVSATMNDIVNMGDGLKKYMDGDIVFTFNKVDVDKKLFDNEYSTSKTGGGYMKNAQYVYVKRAGKAPLPANKLEDSIKSKIAAYVPKNVKW